MKIIKITCWNCSNVYEIQVEPLDYEEWQNGMLIQEALPYLSSDHRELLISATCGECWDELFDEDDEEE